MMRRRSLLLLPLVLPFAGVALAEGDGWNLLRQPGAIVLFRHANAPGTGDPEGFRLGDCSTQRNLDAQGRAQAQAIGAAFRQRGIAIGRVLSSQWCRARDTAALAFPGPIMDVSAFNSFFDDRSAEPAATAAALDILGTWQGPGVLAVVTHQVNITALTGVVPRSGEGVIITMRQGRPEVVGRLPPPPVEGP